MLVLSRKVGEEIRLVEAGVTIRVASSSPSKCQLSIEAPRDLTILRGELSMDQRASSVPSPRSALGRLLAWAESIDASQVSNEMPLVDELIERLVELRMEAARNTQSEPIAIALDDLSSHRVVRQSSSGYSVPGCC